MTISLCYWFKIQKETGETLFETKPLKYYSDIEIKKHLNSFVTSIFSNDYTRVDSIKINNNVIFIDIWNRKENHINTTAIPKNLLQNCLISVIIEELNINI